MIIAGAFGHYIDVESAIAIGILLPLPLDRFRQMGNVAGVGARLALVASARSAEVQQQVRCIKYLYLASTPNSARTFAEATFLGCYRLTD